MRRCADAPQRSEDERERRDGTEQHSPDRDHPHGCGRQADQRGIGGEDEDVPGGRITTVVPTPATTVSGLRNHVRFVLIARHSATSVHLEEPGAGATDERGGIWNDDDIIANAVEDDRSDVPGVSATDVQPIPQEHRAQALNDTCDAP